MEELLSEMRPMSYARNWEVQVSLHSYEWGALDGIARLRGVSRGEVVRQLVMKEAERLRARGRIRR
jgi:hypothetical protein